jgi:hypothetical protein
LGQYINVIQKTTVISKEANKVIGIKNQTRESSLNEKIQLSRINQSSPLVQSSPILQRYILDYCQGDAVDGCFIPNDISGQWEFTPNSNATFASNVSHPNNRCHGWNFGEHCENGYMRNLECSGFDDPYRWHFSFSFDSKEACRLLQNRTVLIMGDSTGGQSSSSIINRFVEGGCSERFQFILSDTLIRKQMGAMNRGIHWKQAISDHQPDILIFAIGAHVYGEDNFKSTFDEVIQDMVRMQEEGGSKVPIFIYKTITPGGCTPTIVDDMTPDEIGRHYDNDQKFNWHTFYGRDLYAISQCRLHNISVLDGRMLYSRSDGHTRNRFGKDDCLHWCSSPGPLDVFADLFYDILQHELKQT